MAGSDDDPPDEFGLIAELFAPLSAGYPWWRGFISFPTIHLT